MPRDYRRSSSRSPDRRGGSSRPRSGSRSRSRSGDRRRHDNKDNSYDRDEEQDFCRLHIADLTKDVSQYELEKSFSRFGELKEVWMAKNPPCFAFIVFKNNDDASSALKEMDQRLIGSCRIRVTYAKPRTKGSSNRKRFDPNMRCYQCGQRGHFSRDCRGGGSSRGGGEISKRRRSYSRERNNGSRRRSRTRSGSRSYSRRIRSRTPRRDYRSSHNMNRSSN